MPPSIDRAPPPYMQIADEIRRRIKDGELSEGDRIPPVVALATEWDVAHATAAKAIGQLQVEGLVITSPRGSFVAAAGAKATSPQDRITRARRGGSTAGAGETHLITDAEVVTAPTYVAELFALDVGGRVVRRQWVTVEGGTIRALTVTWHPAELAARVPELMAREPSGAGTLLGRLEAVVGAVTRGRDYMHARSADAREAAALGLPIGAPILAGTWLAWAGETLVEYGEYCLPSRHTLTYEYEVPAE